MGEDYFVRYGNEYETLGRTFYVSLNEATKVYNSMSDKNKVTWKELIYEPLDEEDVSIVIKREDHKIINIMGKRLVI